jgi:hypothetical protein
MTASITRSLCFGTLLVLPALYACGDDAGGESRGDGGPARPVPLVFPSGTTCGAALEVSGAVDLVLPPSETSTACATGVSVESGFAAGFLFVDSELSDAHIEIDEVKEGETAAGFPARLRIGHDDGREWVWEDCVADVDAHEFVGPAELGWKSYRVAGKIECEVTTAAEGTTDELEVHSLAFVATIHWT